MTSTKIKNDTKHLKKYGINDLLKAVEGKAEESEMQGGGRRWWVKTPLKKKEVMTRLRKLGFKFFEPVFNEEEAECGEWSVRWSDTSGGDDIFQWTFKKIKKGCNESRLTGW